jgi:putative phage-type endonuclease
MTTPLHSESKIMKTSNLIQGSPEWLAYRREHFNASDAPAMMGCSPYKTRSQLLHEMATGMVPEVDAKTQSRFDDGHRFEALARPLAEVIIGEDLYPVTGNSGKLSASFDGLTMDESIAWEHKTLNAELRNLMRDDCLGSELPLHYRVQMEHQCMVSGSSRVLFTASKWSGEDCDEVRHCWYTPDPDLLAKIGAGWNQFAADLAAYVPPAATEPAPTGKAPDMLPALRIEVTGQVTASNLAEFKQTALAAIHGVNRELKTDADFANAEASVKWCSEVESRLAAAKEHALSQTASIDALFKTIDDISAEARRVRLDLDKLVKARKAEIKEYAVLAARSALEKHVANLNGELAPMRLQPEAWDFTSAIKGLRSIASMQDALDMMLANGKISYDAQARLIRANVAVFKAEVDGLEFLFPDLGLIVHKAPDDFALAVRARVDAHRASEVKREADRVAAEARRMEAERERIREEERTRAAKIEAERIARERIEPAQQQRIRDEQAKAQMAMPAAPIQAPTPAPAVVEFKRPVPAPVSDEPATLKLGTICERLGFTVNAAFLADTLNIHPAGTDKRAVLFRESQWPVICRQLTSHISAMAELYEQAAA